MTPRQTNPQKGRSTGVVIRPAAFIRAAARVKAASPGIGTGSAGGRRIDARMAAIILAIAALAWIVALAGAAFAMRAALVICFTALARRSRRAEVPVRSTPRR
jgi:hypothetical protein